MEINSINGRNIPNNLLEPRTTPFLRECSF